MQLILNIAAVFFTSSWATILTTSAASPNHKTPLMPHNAENACSVEAWVRAEDLSPNAVANGELRIKVNPACTEEISSVALQLQLDEFGEVKYLKEGAILPTPPGNGSVLSDQWERMYLYRFPVDSEYVKYFESLREPALWVLKAEERTAFKTVATLMEKSYDYARPIVVPFVVATPNVNYPPGQTQFGSGAQNDLRKAGSTHAYRYTALVSFSGGRRVDIPAGYTTFLPTHAIPPSANAFSQNISFEPIRDCRQGRFNECTSDMDKTVFGAQVTLEGGNVVRAGDTLKVRVDINHLINGSTTAKDISIWMQSERDNHWAKSQADSGGDVDTFLSDIYAPNREISTSGCQHSHILGDQARCGGLVRAWHPSHYSGILSEDKKYLEFELKVSEDAIRDFRTYYVSYKTSLIINLGVAYSPAVQRCVVGDAIEKQAVQDAEEYEENTVWGRYGSVSKPYKTRDRFAQTLQATQGVPIIVIGAQHPGASHFLTPPPTHYLASNITSPLILAAPPQAVVFPLSQAAITPEQIENTTLRLMAPPSIFMGITSYFPDYFSGTYVGLLWKKKIMSENFKAEARRLYGSSKVVL